jgi:hypothetical protein
MSDELADPGHVGYVRRWLKHNAERIAASVEPPGPADSRSTGSDFVRWVANLLDQHQHVCQQDADRSMRTHSKFTGD